MECKIDIHYYEKCNSLVLPTDGYCNVTDMLSKKMENGSTLANSNRAMKRVFSEIDAAMIKSVCIPTFGLGNFVPGHERDPPKADENIGVFKL